MFAKKSFLILIVLFIAACSNPGEDKETLTRKPEYFSEFSIGKVLYNQKIETPNYSMGTYKTYTLILEPYKGIHLTNNATDEQSEIFWDFAGITEFSIEGENITFCMMKDKFAVNISDVDAPILTFKAFGNTVDINSLSPYKLDGSFECVDPSKGYIKNWKIENTFDPKCWK